MKRLVDYQGRTVRLTDERSQYILEHPEMVGMEAAIEQTLKEPETVFRSTTDPAVALSYRSIPGTLVGDKWLCVVVKYLVNDAFVLTAYLTDQPQAGEILWPRR